MDAERVRRLLRVDNGDKDAPKLPPAPNAPVDAKLQRTVEQWHRLKEQGVHFNARLRASARFHNPALLDMFVAHLGIEPSGTRLSGSLCDPAVLADEPSYLDLARIQQQVSAQLKTSMHAETASPADVGAVRESLQRRFEPDASRRPRRGSRWR